MCVCVRACVRASCVRACVVRACVRACVCVCVFLFLFFFSFFLFFFFLQGLWLKLGKERSKHFSSSSFLFFLRRRAEKSFRTLFQFLTGAWPLTAPLPPPPPPHPPHPQPTSSTPSYNWNRQEKCRNRRKPWKTGQLTTNGKPYRAKWLKRWGGNLVGWGGEGRRDRGY